MAIPTAKFKNLSYSSGEVLKYEFLKSCRVSLHMAEIPEVMRGYNFPRYLLRDIEFFCDAIEIPGKSLQTTEFKISGLNRAKVPILRNYNEITLSFYHPADEFPMFDYFSTWIELAAPRDSQVAYYDDIVIKEGVQITQWEATKNTVNFATILINAFPTSVASLQGNWADEGYHKVNITMAFEDSIMASNVGKGSINNIIDLENRIKNSNNPFFSPQSEINRDVFDNE